MHPVRELQECRQQRAEGLECKASRIGNMATTEVLIDRVQNGAVHYLTNSIYYKLRTQSPLIPPNHTSLNREFLLSNSFIHYCHYLLLLIIIMISY
ncbi:Endoribonuclease Dicer like 1 [Dendrobium catenatum]|uniref:Endoribonuclease Dicer like 1 n=1 Tax=Dendrobium catenatum TaxID=906689 RepID=A0A2I0VZL9_9ASPA|nr:Endoribonuclease Dicer like 1 [Dendrobium catenatum]